MMKMGMADEAKINFDPLQSVVNPLAIDAQRVCHLINRLSADHATDHLHLQIIEWGSQPGGATLTLMARRERAAAICQTEQKAADLLNALPLADPQEGIRVKGASAFDVVGGGKSDHQAGIALG